MLTGNAYCDWNAFTWVRPKPRVLQTGDMIIWSWSGDSAKPSSNQHAGLFKVSVWDGKKRRQFTVRNTPVNSFLRYKDGTEREKNLRALIPALQGLKGMTIEYLEGGYQVALNQPAPAATAATPPTA